jgi:hypothetical protein
MAAMHGSAETDLSGIPGEVQEPGLGASNTAAAHPSQARNPDRGTIELLPVQGSDICWPSTGGEFGHQAASPARSWWTPSRAR